MPLPSIIAATLLITRQKELDLPFPTTPRNFPVRPNCARFLPPLTAVKMTLQLLCSFHILHRLLPDQLLALFVLLPFQREHEELQGGVVDLVGLFVFAGIVVLNGLLHGCNRATKEVGVRHRDEGGVWSEGRLKLRRFVAELNGATRN